jgi:hypothetical protein
VGVEARERAICRTMSTRSSSTITPPDPSIEPAATIPS